MDEFFHSFIVWVAVDRSCLCPAVSNVFTCKCDKISFAVQELKNCLGLLLGFVTGWGGVAFHSPGPPVARGQENIFQVIPARVPANPWTGPVSHHLFLTGACLGNRSAGGRGRESQKNPPPRAIRRGGPGNGACVFWSPRGPVTNASCSWQSQKHGTSIGLSRSYILLIHHRN